MKRIFLAASVALLSAACGGDETLPDDCGVVTWESFGDAYMRTWCVSCHSTQLETPEARFGAPMGVDFDTLALVQGQLSDIERRATGSSPTMPPAGEIPPADVQRLTDWLACGAPGVDLGGGSIATGNGCSGDAVIRSGDADVDASDWCDGDLHVVVDGDVRVSADVDGLDCLCEVDGNLTVGAGVNDATLDALWRVGGTVSVVPDGRLDVLDVSAMVDVGGDVLVEGAPLHALDLSRLQNVGGSLRIADLPNLQVITGFGDNLHVVGGDIVVRDNAALKGFEGFEFLQSVGGDIVWESNASIVEVNGFTVMDTLGGTLRIAGNDALQVVDGFDNLLDVGGGIEIVDNPSLRSEEAFGGFSLAVSSGSPEEARQGQVGGDLVIADNPLLVSLQGLSNIRSVGGVRFERNISMGQLLGFPLLTQIGGDLVVADQLAMANFTAFSSVRFVQGHFDLSRNTALTGIGGLGSLESVGGDFTISGNTLLPQEGVEAFACAVDVGGTRAIGSECSDL